MELEDFNIINLSQLDESKILSRINQLFSQEAIGDYADTPRGIMQNATILTKVLPYYSELANRTEKEFRFKKIDLEEMVHKQIVISRNEWEINNPNKKVPAMSYFESEANIELKQDKEKLVDLELKAKRFKDLKEACIEQIQVLKKKQEGLKIV